MNLVVKFEESEQSFNPKFGEIHEVSDGGFERGYAAGYEDGLAEPKYINTLSQYVKITARPVSSAIFTIDNPLGGVAQKVSVRCVDGSNASVSNGVIRQYCADADSGIGGMRLMNASTGKQTLYGVVKTAEASSNSQFAFTEGEIILRAYNGTTACWDKNSDYEVEIYQ